MEYVEEIINIYMLLYKLDDYPYIWIVRISDSYEELYDTIKKFNNENEIGIYYIIKRKYNTSLMPEKFRQFQLFNIQKYDNVIHSTE